MHEHEEDSEQSGCSVKVVSQATGHLEHEASAPCVAHKAEPKEGQVPRFQAAGQAFCPDTDRVEDEGEGDDDSGCACHGLYPISRKMSPIAHLGMLG